MQTANKFTFRYNDPRLHERCIAFSFYGSVLLKKLFKNNEMDCRVQVKRYVINEDDDDDDYQPYHYYIEIKTPTGKTIIDNCDSYDYSFYMNKYKPRGTIEKVGERDIKKNYYENAWEVANIIEDTIYYHFENIRNKYILMKNRT
jgi:hypothetical protein